MALGSYLWPRYKENERSPVTEMLAANRRTDSFGCVTVTATTLAENAKDILDRVIRGGEVVHVQQHGKTVAEIRPHVGVCRFELLRLLDGRGFNGADTQKLQEAMDATAAVVGYAGRD